MSLDLNAPPSAGGQPEDLLVKRRRAVIAFARVVDQLRGLAWDIRSGRPHRAWGYLMDEARQASAAVGDIDPALRSASEQLYRLILDQVERASEQRPASRTSEEYAALRVRDQRIRQARDALVALTEPGPSN